jgi:hypothetical protein
MPNWVENRIAFKKEYLDVAKAMVENGICETVDPMPEEIKNTSSPSDTPNWYNWALEHWGTKWGDVETQLHEEECVLEFQSAWSPLNDEMVEKLLNLFNGTMKYWWQEEQGFGAQTTWIFHDKTDHKEWDDHYFEGFY